MNEEQIKALLEGLRTSLLEEVDRKNSGLASSINKGISKQLEEFKNSTDNSNNNANSENKGNVKSTEKNNNDDVEKASLNQKVASLEQRLQNSEKEAFEARKSEKVATLVAKSNTVGKGVLTREFVSKYGDKIEFENGSYYVKDNDKVVGLEDSFNEFLKTDDAKLFIPASKVKGSNSQTIVTGDNKSEDSKKASDEQLMNAFSSI